MNRPIEFSKLQPYIREAGQIALGYYQTQLIRQQKEDFSPVTEADKAVEAYLIEKIQQLYPTGDYEIIGEESGGTYQGKEFAWAIDPIDGTRIFIDGLPSWCISVGLLRGGEVYRGIVYLPVVNEMYYTDDDGRPFWNDRSLLNSLQDRWGRDSFIGVSSGAHRYFDIDFRRVRAFGAIATHHVYVARGASVAALHRKAAVWDVAGAHAILAAAGGVATYLDGSALAFPQFLAQKQIKSPILVGHPAVVEKLLPKIKLVCE